MRRIVTTAFLIAIFGVCVYAQTQQYAAPDELKIDRLVRQNFRQFFGRQRRYPQLIPETFYPIGWSRDGKFAYYVEPVDEACGCYFANLVIQDMIDDKVLWEFKYTQDTEMDGNNKGGSGDIDALWKKNRKLFSEKLAEHKIIASRFPMLGKMFTSSGNRFTAKSSVKMGTNPDYGEQRVDKFTITLTASKIGTKTVYSADNSEKEYWFMLDAGVIGALKSPYEERIAIVAIEVMRGYEGPPHTADIRIVGADLKSGFSRK